MRLKQMGFWLFLAYYLASTEILVISLIFVIRSPVRLGNVVISANLASLVFWIANLSEWIIVVYYFIFRMPNSLYTRLERRNAIIVGTFISLCGGTGVIVFIGLSVWDVAHNSQDVAMLAIMWAFVAPAIILAAKSLFAGIFGALGKSLYETATQTDNKKSEKNTH